MSIISRYLTRETGKIFGIVLIIILGVYITVDFFEKVDNFIDAKLSLQNILVFFLCKTPFIFAQMTPVGLLLAILIVLGLMKKNNEITALKCAGVSVTSLLKPILALGFLSSVFLFLFIDMVVPVTLEKSNTIWLKDVKQKKIVRSKQKNIWIKGRNRITHIKFYDQETQSIYGISINRFDDDFRLTARIDAQRGVFTEEKWHLYHTMEQKIGPASGETSVIFREHRIEPLGFLPDDFKEIIKKPEEMKFGELFRLMQEMEADGYDATAYRVDLYAKAAFPAVCFFLSMVGAGLTLSRKSREGIAVGIISGIGVAFVYWIFYSFCLSLGYGKMLPPLIAAWATNAIFLCIGILLILRAN